MAKFPFIGWIYDVIVISMSFFWYKSSRTSLKNSKLTEHSIWGEETKSFKMKVFISFVALATVLVANAQVSMHNPFYCYTADPIRPQNEMHSTQSSYEAIRRVGVDPNVSCKLIWLEMILSMNFLINYPSLHISIDLHTLNNFMIFHGTNIWYVLFQHARRHDSGLSAVMEAVCQVLPQFKQWELSLTDL